MTALLIAVIVAAACLALFECLDASGYDIDISDDSEEDRP